MTAILHRYIETWSYISQTLYLCWRVLPFGNADKFVVVILNESAHKRQRMLKIEIKLKKTKNIINDLHFQSLSSLETDGS